MNAIRLGAGLLILSLLQTACASPPTRTFTLDAVGPSSPLIAAGALRPLRIDAVRLPAWLNRPELVRETAAHEMQVDDFAMWSGPLAQLARRTLTQDLLTRLPAGAVVFPDSPAPEGAAEVVVDILSLSRDGDRVVMDVSWTELRPQPASSATSPRVSPHPLQLSARATPQSPGAMATDLSLLLAALADEIAAKANEPRYDR